MRAREVEDKKLQLFRGFLVLMSSDRNFLNAVKMQDCGQSGWIAEEMAMGTELRLRNYEDRYEVTRMNIRITQKYGKS